MSSAKLQAALGHVKEAEKALKTSLFKWSPDYDTAASEYTKAATNFKVASSLEQSKECFIKASEMQEKLNSLFHSAKLLVQAAGIAKELSQIEQAVDLMEKACYLYQSHGVADTAAITLSKAGKMCEEQCPDKAVQFYTQAADLCETNDKIRDATDHINNAVKVELRNKRNIKACKLMERRIEMLLKTGNTGMAHKVVLCLVIAYLTERDNVAANNSYQSGFQLGGFAESDECTNAESFIKAFEDGDEELLFSTCNQANVKHLDVEIARLAKSLKIPGGGKKQVPKDSNVEENSVGVTNEAEGAVDNTPEGVESSEEEEGDLC